MADVHSKEQRSRNMAAIRGRDTTPEVEIRRRLHAKGFRYRLHRADLPGKPDIVLSSYSALIMVNGCFWHWHGCSLCKVPGSRTEWWRRKLARTVERDREIRRQLLDAGWRVCNVWECAFRGKGSRAEALDRTADRLAVWLRGTAGTLEIPRRPGGSSDRQFMSRLESLR